MKNQRPYILSMVQWVETCDEEVDRTLCGQFQRSNPGYDFVGANSELAHVLTHLTYDRAARIIMNAANNQDIEGILAWQRLCRDANGEKREQALKLSRTVLHPKRVQNIQQFADSFEEWEQQLRKLEMLGHMDKYPNLRKSLPSANYFPEKLMSKWRYNKVCTLTKLCDNMSGPASLAAVGNRYLQNLRRCILVGPHVPKAPRMRLSMTLSLGPSTTETTAATIIPTTPMRHQSGNSCTKARKAGKV